MKPHPHAWSCEFVYECVHCGAQFGRNMRLGLDELGNRECQKCNQRGVKLVLNPRYNKNFVKRQIRRWQRELEYQL